MSAPVIPCLPDNDQRQVFNSLMVSIALEETALAHILNAEGEKIQAMVCKMKSNCPPTNCEVIDFQKSVGDILKLIIKKEMLLQFKLEDILEANKLDCKPHHPKPCPPPCPPNPCPPCGTCG